MSHVYFPAGAIVSLVCCPSVERATEVALVADEGFIGQPMPRVGPLACPCYGAIRGRLQQLLT